MPSVPRYTNRVATAPLGRPSVPDAAFIPPNPVVRPVDLRGVADVATKMYEAEREKVDQVFILEMDNELSRISSDLRARALERRGKDALGVSTEVSDEWNKEIAKVEGRARNDRQMLAFRERAGSRGSNLYEAVERHASAEWRTFEESETEAALANRVTDATENYADPAKLRTAVTEARGIAEERARRNGFAPDSQTYIDTVTKAVTSVHLGAISQMVATGNDQLALRYFNEVKDDLDGKVLPEITRQLEVTSTATEASSAVNTVWAEIGPKTRNDPVLISMMADQIRERYKGNDRVIKAAVGELTARAGLFNAEQSETRASNKAAVFGAFNQGASRSQVSRMPEYLALPGDEQNGVMTYITDRAYQLGQRARSATGESFSASETAKTKRHFATYYRTSDPAVLANMSEAMILSMEDRMGQNLVSRLMEQKRGMGKAGGSATANLDADQFKVIARSAGYDPAARDDDTVARLGQIRNEVEARIAEEQQSLGRPVSRERRGAIATEVIDQTVMVDLRAKGDRVTPAITVLKDERSRVYKPMVEIDPAQLKVAINYMRSVGKILPAETDQQATARHQRRIERAIGAQISGADDDEVFSILRGEK